MHLELEVAADFAHVFDVKSGATSRRHARAEDTTPGRWTLQLPVTTEQRQHRGDAAPRRRTEADPARGTAGWRAAHRRAGGGRRSRSPCSPVSAGVPADLELPVRAGPWHGDPRADRLALGGTVRGLARPAPARRRRPGARRPGRAAHRRPGPPRPRRRGRRGSVVHDALRSRLAADGLDDAALRRLPRRRACSPASPTSRAREDDPASEEQPGRILHELRRHGGSGPFSSRSRYYGTVDATPLFVGLAAEAWRWRAIDDDALRRLAPALGRAVDWITRTRRLRRRRVPRLPPSATREGSPTRAGRTPGTASPAPTARCRRRPWPSSRCRATPTPPCTARRSWPRSWTSATTPPTCVARAEALKDRFNEAFWDPRGYFVLGLDARRAPIDSLTTNPGHALWSGIADDDKARRYVERLVDPDLWTGWGLRTLARSMAAYDPLSYHNGSVWPHDTALCIAGAARYGCWDAVDLLVDGALEATRHFDGRPPELFAGAGPRRRSHAGGLPVLVLAPGLGVGLGAAARTHDARVSSRRPTVPASSWCAPTSPGYRTSPWSALSSPVTPCRSPCTTAEARSRRLTLRSGLITAMLAVNWTSMTSAPGIEFDSVRRSSHPAPQHRRRALWQSRKANRQRARHRRNTAHSSVGHLRVPQTRPVKRLVTARQTATAGGEPDRSICVRVDLRSGVSKHQLNEVGGQ